MIWAYYVALRCNKLIQIIFNGFTLRSGSSYTLLSVHVLYESLQSNITIYGMLPKCQVLITCAIPVNPHNESGRLKGVMQSR